MRVCSPPWLIAKYGKTIVFFAYRDGGYDIWAINPDGTNQRKLTWGTFDDREPVFSHERPNGFRDEPDVFGHTILKRINQKKLSSLLFLSLIVQLFLTQHKIHGMV